MFTDLPHTAEMPINRSSAPEATLHHVKELKIQSLSGEQDQHKAGSPGQLLPPQMQPLSTVQNR